MRRPLPAIALAAAVLLIVLPALGLRRPRVKYGDGRISRPSARYASMTRGACLKALAARKISFTRVEKARGVLAPVRLTGPIGGVLFRTDAPAGERAASPAEVYDCRLVLALHDLSKILAAHGIDEARTASAWRPPPSSWPAGKIGTRHRGALAVDVKRLGKRPAPGDRARRWLSIQADFQGKIGGPVCGVTGLGEGARTLRAIVCEARDRGLFTSILTPSYDRAHRDHVHLELRPGVAWSLFL